MVYAQEIKICNNHTIILVGRAAPKFMTQKSQTINKKKKNKWLFFLILAKNSSERVKLHKSLKKHSSVWSAIIWKALRILQCLLKKHKVFQTWTLKYRTLSHLSQSLSLHSVTIWSWHEGMLHTKKANKLILKLSN